jgi:hypothetical protein
MRTTTYLLTILFMAIGTSKAEDRSLPNSEAELSVTLERSRTPNTFHLSARNSSHSSVLIVRPRVHTVDTYSSWGGWSLHVQGPGGHFHALALPGGIQPFTSIDLIELRPGESVGVVINLSQFTRDNKALLADLPGNYTVVARYRLEQQKVVLASGPANGEGFVPVPILPAMESEAVQFVVPGNGK